jgi:hypothetical protein
LLKIEANFAETVADFGASLKEMTMPIKMPRSGPRMQKNTGRS